MSTFAIYDYVGTDAVPPIRNPNTNTGSLPDLTHNITVPRLALFMYHSSSSLCTALVLTSSMYYTVHVQTSAEV